MDIVHQKHALAELREHGVKLSAIKARPGVSRSALKAVKHALLEDIELARLIERRAIPAGLFFADNLLDGNATDDCP